MTLATLHDEQRVETINLSFGKFDKSREARIGTISNPYRYTNIVFLQGVHGMEIKVEGVFIPPFTSSAAVFSTNAWITSTGNDPTQTLMKWERLGTSLQYNDETGSLTSVNVAS